MSILRKSLARPDDKGRSGRERSSRRCKFPLTSSFRSLVAHPGRRRHPAPRDRPRHGPDRDPLAHRRIRRTAGGTRGPPRNRQAQPLAGGRDGDPPWPDHPHRSARRPAQRRRPDHRPRCPFDVKAVQWIRHAHHVPAPAPYAAGEISVAGAAERLHCSIGSSTTGSRPANSPPRHGPGNRLCIPWDDNIHAEYRCRITESGHLNPASRRTTPRACT